MSEQKQIRSVVYILATVALIIVAVITLVLMSAEEAGRPASDTRSDDFVLTSSSGPVSLKQFRGEVVLLFFGYTHCPDICPTTMSNVAAAMDLLTPDEQKSVQPIFITVDPDRDSPEQLAEYVAFFHPKIIGLSGSMQKIREAAKKYSVEFFIEHNGEATDGKQYLVNHSSYLFLIDRNGEVADMMSSFTTPADIATALRKHISR